MGKVKKICIICTSLNYGGAERASANQSIIFDKLGYEVFIVTVKSGVSYEYKGEIFDLGIYKDKNNSSLGRITRLIRLKRFLKKHKFDFIVDNRQRNKAYREFIVTKFIYRTPTIYVVHSFEESLAFTKYKWLNKYLYQKEIVVCVSKNGRQKFEELYQLKNSHTIYNAFNFESIIKQSEERTHDLNFKNYIIYCGRINDKSKNLKLLLDGYKFSSLSKNNIKLVILGEGEDLEFIKNYVKMLNLKNDVVFKGFSKNPYPYFKHAKFSVLTSRSEGFAMVLPESLSLGTPVISVNCEAGPKEILKNKFNGLLVENFNENALASAFDTFIKDTTLYETCKINAVDSVFRFSIEIISKEWEKLLT